MLSFTSRAEFVIMAETKKFTICGWFSRPRRITIPGRRGAVWKRRYPSTGACL